MAEEPTSLEQLAAQAAEADAAEETPAADPTAPVPPEDAESDVPETESDSEPDDSPEPAAEADDADRLRWLEEVTGHKFSQKYRSSDEAGRGIGHALELLGQRDEDAQLGRRLKDQLGTERLQELLEAAPAASQPSSGEDGMPQTFEEYELLLDKAGEAKSKDDPIYQRAVRANRAFAQKQFDVVRRFDETLGKVEAIAKQLDQWQTASVEQGHEQAKHFWVQQHNQELFKEDGQLSALGEQVQKLHDQDPDCQDWPDDSVQRWRLAYRFARLQQPKPKPTKQASRHAVHQAGAAVPPEKPPTIDEMMKQGVSGPKILEALSKAE